MKHHRLSVTLTDEGTGVFSIDCPFDDPDRPCGVFHEGTWFDGTTCRCTDIACPCRDGDHYGCQEIDGYVNDIGPKCRCEPDNDCWYSYAISEHGADMLNIIGSLTASWPVDVSGSSWDEPIDVSLIEEEPF